MQAPTHIFDQRFPKDKQRAFALSVAERFGFDPQRGRVDESHHPFEILFTHNDVRMTTRYNERYLPGAVFGLFHETGHALYEQNVDPQLTCTVLATDLLGMYAVGGTNFGLHESQSRLWENMVGRSRSFWLNHYADLQATFPEQLSGVDVETLLPRGERCQAEPHPGRGGRGDLQPSHHAAHGTGNGPHGRQRGGRRAG